MVERNNIAAVRTYGQDGGGKTSWRREWCNGAQSITSGNPRKDGTMLSWRKITGKTDTHTTNKYTNYL